MKKIILIIGSIMFLPGVSKAQFEKTCITIDPDGYTNIREQPNARSKIIGRVSKYEIFYSLGDDFCGNNMFRTGNWMPVSSDTATGYMYDKYIRGVTDLPILSIKNDTQEFEAGTIICFNDTLTVTMKIRKFEHRPTADERVKLEGMLHDPDVIEYMKKNGLSDTKIEEITIFNRHKGVKTILPLDKIKKYCNPGRMEIRLGRSNELYLCIGGGSEACSYGVWLTILNGQIIYQTYMLSCW